MSLRAHLWAMDDAPVKNPTAALILLALADEANDEAEGACPYMDKLVQRGRCSERSAQDHLRALFRARIINLGDPGVALRRYKKSPGRAPRVWDLNMSATWASMPTPRTDEEMLEYSAMIGQRPVRRAAEADTGQGSDQEEQRGVQILHPSDGGQERGVQNLHPSDDTASDQAVQTDDDKEDHCEGCGGSHPRGAGARTPGVRGLAPFLSVPACTRSSPPPSTSLTDARDSLKTEEGDQDSKKEPVLTEIVGWFTKLRPDWRPEVVAEVLTAAVDRELGDLRAVAAALRELADGKHGQTESPRRLLYADGPWWANVRPKRSRAAAALAAAPRCGRKGHAGDNAAGECSMCLGEVRACPSCPSGATSCEHGDQDADREISAEAKAGEARFLAGRQRSRRVAPAGRSA